MAVVPILAEPDVAQLGVVNIDKIINVWIVLKYLIALIVCLKVYPIYTIVFFDEAREVGGVEDIS